MEPQPRLLQPTLSRPLLVGVTFLVAVQVLLLTPSSLERTPFSRNIGMSRQEVINLFRTSNPIAPGVPVDQIPTYAVRKLEYTSSKGEMREWKILGENAHVYRLKDKPLLTHIRQIRILIYDEQGGVTTVTGQEGKYISESEEEKTRVVEVFGNAETRFSDGFVFYSDYVKYIPEQKLIQVPDQYLVQGDNGENPTDSKRIRFSAHGLDSHFDTQQILLHKDVDFLTSKYPASPEGPKGSDYTAIRSDHARIERKDQNAYFSMNPSRPLRTRFVRINQPELFVRSRNARINYGNSQGSATKVKDMTAYDDVFVRELKEESELQYATCGRADFDSKTNIIVMTKFPQAYQNNDTVTGRIIRVLRDKDIVEVDYSNAYSENQDDETRPPKKKNQSFEN